MTKKQTQKQEQKQPDPIVIRKTTEYLRVDYSPEELASKAQEMAAKAAELDAISDEKASAKAAELDAISDEKASAMSSFGARVKKAKGELDVLTDQVRSKGEHRSVKCEWHMNTPARAGRPSTGPIPIPVP